LTACGNAGRSNGIVTIRGTPCNGSNRSHAKCGWCVAKLRQSLMRLCLTAALPSCGYAVTVCGTAAETRMQIGLWIKTLRPSAAGTKLELRSSRKVASSV
jgi:hypothetical protein